MHSTEIVDSCDYVYDPIGIESINFSDQIELIPNPAQDFVTIKAKDYSSYSIKVFDLYGRLLISEKAFDSNFKLKYHV